MPKLAFLALAVLVPLTGCQMFKRSPAWATVTKARIETRGASDPSKTYATGLSHELAAQRVEHKVVTYQYRYRTRLREEAVATRSAVLYKDPTNPANPWWLKDDLNTRPIWLPNGAPEKQIAFYIRRGAEVVREVPGGDAKEVIGERLPAIETRIAKTHHRKSAPKTWAEPERLVAVAEPHADLRESAAPHRTDWSQVFRVQHGTPFDPASPVDRAKMERVLARAGGDGVRTF
jgi:hypothetical protein